MLHSSSKLSIIYIDVFGKFDSKYLVNFSSFVIVTCYYLMKKTLDLDVICPIFSDRFWFLNPQGTVTLWGKWKVHLKILSTFIEAFGKLPSSAITKVNRHKLISYNCGIRDLELQCNKIQFDWFSNNWEPHLLNVN